MCKCMCDVKEAIIAMPYLKGKPWERCALFGEYSKGRGVHYLESTLRGEVCIIWRTEQGGVHHLERTQRGEV